VILNQNKMEKEFIPYEQALEIKELSFDEICIAGYDGKELKSIYKQFMSHEPHISAPLYQQAFRWFREKYGLYFSIQYFQYDEWCLQITTKKEDIVFNHKSVNEFKTYEEAELACLKKLIEIVKQK